MKEYAITNGIYLGPSGSRGYHIIFLNDGSVRINKVTRTGSIRGYAVPGQGLGNDGAGGCRRRYQLIRNETLVGTYYVSDAPLIFAEDHLWVEGTLDGRTTVPLWQCVFCLYIREPKNDEKPRYI